MQRMTTVVLLIVLAGLMYGCQPPAKDDGGSTNTATPSSDSSASVVPGNTPQLKVIRHADPVHVVTEFLTALQRGDHATATAMLSVKAQKETAARNMGISPPGSSSATFSVDRESVMEPGDGTTLVLSSWTDIDSNGMKQTYDVGWMLKQDGDGLAITGMATRVFENSENLILNFEDPDDMLRQRQMAEQEIAQRKRQLQQQQNVARDADGQPIVR